MLWGALFSWLSAGWWWIFLIRRTFNAWVHSPGRSFADKAGNKGDHSDNLNAATPSCWKSDQDGLTISSVSKMNPKAVIHSLWAWYSFCVVCRSWLPGQMSKKSWALAIQCNFLWFAYIINSISFSVSVVCQAGLLPANIPLLAWSNCLIMNFFA